MIGLEESDWEILLDRIRGGRCTPFLGAGACHGALPLGGDVARALAARFAYPLPNTGDLTAVTQTSPSRVIPLLPRRRCSTC